MAAEPEGAPIDGAYWVVPGKLLAGPYPGEYDLGATRRNLQRLLSVGIRSFVSLMEAREEGRSDAAEARYVPTLGETAARLGVEFSFQRFPIADMSVPDRSLLESALAAIEASLSRAAPVYVHCWAGRGRTGILIGAWLIRSRLATPANFVDVIAELRPQAAGRSPETDAQIAFVRALPAGDSPLPDKSSF